MKLIFQSTHLFLTEAILISGWWWRCCCGRWCCSLAIRYLRVVVMKAMRWRRGWRSFHHLLDEHHDLFLFGLFRLLTVEWEKSKSGAWSIDADHDDWFQNYFGKTEKDHNDQKHQKEMSRHRRHNTTSVVKKEPIIDWPSWLIAEKQWLVVVAN